MFEWMASLPPRRMTALPLFRQRAAASAVTLGRDSKIMQTTPSGTRTLSNFSPLGSTQPSMTRPTGSRSVTTLRTASAMPWMRLSVSSRRSSMALESPASRPAWSSFAFSRFSSSLASTRLSAMRSSTASFSAVEARATLREAALAARASCSAYCLTSIGDPLSA